MAFNNITMDLTALNSLTAPNISLNDGNIFSSVVSNANLYTENLIIFASLFIILVIVYLTLTDRTAYGDFGYDDLRGLNIALSACFLIGLTMVSVGWSPNFFAVGVFGTSWLISFIIIMIYENQE